MFSSLTKKLSSFGPRAILAAQISKALSVYFVVDPDEIESSLLDDARIVLRNTTLRKKCYRSEDAPNTVVTVEGVVEEVVFSWTWSFRSSSSSSSKNTDGTSSSSSSSSGMVKDATLTTKGLKVNIGLQPWDEMKNEDIECLVSNANNEDGKPSDASTTETEGFMQTYVQQIVDHLTLQIHDCQFNIHLKNGASLLMTGEGIQLSTLAAANTPGAVTNTIISQLLSLKTFSLVVRDGNNEYPLIDPFGYAVSVTRLSGKRFQGGILSGLEVIGLLKEEETRFHIGREQLKILCDIGILLRPSPDSNQEDLNYHPSQSAEHCQEASTGSEVVENLPEDNLSTTRFSLPLPGFSLILPPSAKFPSDSTRITLASATFEYKADGTVCKIGGSKGITDNGDNLIELNTGCWELDLVTQTFSIKQGAETKSINEIGGADATIYVREDSLKRILSSVNQILDDEEMAILKEAFNNDNAGNMRTQETESKTWTFVMNGSCKLCVEGHRDNATTGRVEVHVAPTKIVVTPTGTNTGGYSLAEMCCGGMKLRSTIDELFQINIPPFSLLDGTVHVEDFIQVSMTSTERAQEIQEFLILFNPLQTDSAAESSSLQCELPFSIEAPTFEFHLNEPRTIVRCQNLSVRESKLQCGLISADGATLNLSAKNCSLDVLPGTDIIVKVEEVTTATLTGIVSLAEPCRGLSVHFRDGNLFVDIPSAKCDAISSPVSQGNGKGSASISVSVPIPTQLRIQSFMFQNLSLQSSISVENFVLGVKQSGSSINIRTGKDLKVKGQHFEHWIDACVDSANACIAFEDGAYFVKELNCLGMLIGPASPSCGYFKATMSKLHHDGESLEISEAVNASMQQLDSRIVASAQILLQALSGLVPTEEASFELPFPIKVPTIRAAVIEPKITIDIDGVSAVITAVCCKKADVAMFQEASVSLADVNFDFNSMQVEIGLVQSLFLKGMLVLSKPVRQAKIEFNDDLSIQLPHPVHINVLSMEKNDESSQSTENPDLPFPINVDIHELNVSQQGQNSNTRIDGASLKVESFVFGGQDPYEDQPLKGAKVSMKINQASSDLFQVVDICCLFVVPLHDLNVLKNMQLSVSSMQVRAGFSSIDWNSFLSSKKDQVRTNTTPTIKAPFSQIGSFHLSISYEGKILASQSNILVPSFKGDATTTSETITTHYTKTIMSRVPGFLTNAKFLGGNIVDLSLQTAAIATSRVAGAVGGAGVGSVMGVAVGDAIRAGVASGKKSRNVDTSDGYKFGDFSRGLIRGARGAATTGAKMRGGDNAYIPGDLTAGSTRAMGEYASNNKSKLATAGGSGVASMVGLAVAGPLGLVAGAYYGVHTSEATLNPTMASSTYQPPMQNSSDPSLEQEMSNTSSSLRPGGTILRNSTKQAPPRQSFDPLAYQMQGLAEPLQNQVPPNQAATYQSTPARNQRNVNANNATATTVSQGMAQASPGQSYRTGASLQAPQPKKAYAFGDLTKGVVSKGKKADGRNEQSRYKFGDFTRGLFK